MKIPLQDSQADIDTDRLQAVFPDIPILNGPYQIWVRNISSEAYSRYISNKVIPTDMTWSELKHVYGTLGIPDDDLSKEQKYLRIVETLREKYLI